MVSHSDQAAALLFKYVHYLHFSPDGGPHKGHVFFVHQWLHDADEPKSFKEAQADPN